MQKETKLLVDFVVMTPILFGSVSCIAYGEDRSNEFVLVEDGVAKAVVVTADNPNPIVNLAVEELIDHIYSSTNVMLEIITESDLPKTEAATRIFIGENKVSHSVGIDVMQLKPDAYYLRTIGTEIFLLGREDNNNYNERSGRNGTLYGVYDFLEKTIGVKWLWPGELGRHVPKHRTIIIPSLDEIVEPKLEWREFRIRHIDRQLRKPDPKIERLGFTRGGLKEYARELRVFLRRHRVGHSTPKVWVTHNKLYKRQFNKHPDWFSLDKKGRRVGPTLEVTNPGLQKYFAEKNPDKHPDQPHIMIGEADDSFYSRSPESMAWDEPLPAGWNNWKHRVTSNRYARFAAAVRDKARDFRQSEDFLVTTFIYMSYLHPPTIDIDLQGVHGSFCPWFQGYSPWYPMSEKEHNRIMDAWLGWSKTGIEMAYRPNYLLGGYVMPHLSTWQAGEMFQYAVEHGMRGFDFDSLWAHWSAKGPMLYMHMRLGWDPSLTIDDAREEYFTAFGPAAAVVEEYFDYWENYSATKARRGGVKYRSAELAARFYPENAFEHAYSLIALAENQVKNHDDPVLLERVRFLKLGLDQARLAAEFVSTLNAGKYTPVNDLASFNKSKRALERLINFRKRHEHTLFSDLVAATYPENRGLVIDPLFEKFDDEKSHTSSLSVLNMMSSRQTANSKPVKEPWKKSESINSH